MSGFDVNVLSTKPVIREAASMQNDGGAGNLGYMQQGENEQEEKKRRFDESIFSKKEKDVFISEKDLKFKEPEEKFSIAKFIAQIILAIKKFFNIK